MPKDSYEFGYISQKEKRKVLIAKICMGLVMASCLFWMAVDNSDLSSSLTNISAILSAIFGYVNLMTVKSELVELFEPPFQFVGYEFIIVGFSANIASFFV